MKADTETAPEAAQIPPQAQGESLSGIVYDYLSEQIIRGEIRYGDRLHVKTLASRLNVSPMPIRDALKRLEMEGLVVIKARSSSYVRVPTKKTTLQALSARRMLEVSAVREVYSGVTAVELSPLNVVLDAMGRLVRRTAGHRGRTEVEEYIDLDQRFHTEICALAHNDYINRFYREICMHLNMSFRYGTGVCHGVEATYHDHEQIFRYLSLNSVQAVELLEAHLIQSKQNVLKEPTYQMLQD